jgi:ribosomal-protein-alanine N-acetyltransferase
VFSIRNIEPNDMFSVIKLASRNLPERYNPNLFTYFYETFPQGFIIAGRAHKIIGFILGIKISDSTGRILMLTVDEKFRKIKIGTTLLNRLENLMKKENVKNLELEVRIDNITAVKFYEKNGFKIREKVEKFYPNGEDAYIMDKSL